MILRKMNMSIESGLRGNSRLSFDRPIALISTLIRKIPIFPALQNVLHHESRVVAGYFHGTPFRHMLQDEEVYCVERARQGIFPAQKMFDICCYYGVDTYHCGIFKTH